LLIDDFLIPYADEKEGLGSKIAQQLKNYRKVINRMPKGWLEWLLPQLIAHRLFKKNGLAGTYILKEELQRRSPEEREYFQFQIDHPWRFTYCSIENHVSKDFFEMKDAITEEKFLLYSQGVSEILEETGGTVSLWFFLMGSNGECFQTYGTIIYYKGIQPFDLFYFAKQIKNDIVFLTEVQDVIESNPIPFTMTYIGALTPVTYHKDDMVVFNNSEYYVKDFKAENYAEDFIIEEKHPIYMLSLKKWNGFPHFAKCYYHAKKNRFLIMSMTIRGYGELVAILNKHGNNFPLNPDTLATPAMLYIAKEVLNVDMETDPYDKHFAKKPSPSESVELDKINALLRSLMPLINNRKKYDIAELAQKTGVDVEVARNLEQNMLKKISEIGR
jgi:hypothetical protein